MHILKSLLTGKQDKDILSVLKRSLKTHYKKRNSLVIQKKHLLTSLAKIDAAVIKNNDTISRAETAVGILEELQKPNDETPEQNP